MKLMLQNTIPNALKDVLILISKNHTQTIPGKIKTGRLAILVIVRVEMRGMSQLANVASAMNPLGDRF